MGYTKKKMGTLGENSKLIILHGWTCNTEKWGPFFKLLKQNRIEYEMLKIPGLTTPLNEVWTLDDYVSWLDKKTKSESRITLLGHSNGGRISLAYTLKHPEKVSHLILIDSAGIYHNEISLWLKRFVFKNLSRFKKIAYSSVLKNLLYKLAREGDYNKASANMKKTMQNLIESDLTDQMKKISAPTTIIWGENDTTTPLLDAKLMKEKIRNSRLFVIRGAKHSPQFSNPEEVVKIIKEVI